MTARQTVLARAGWRCERCLSLPVDHVHHRRPKGSGGTSEEWVERPANIVALCRPCHEWAHAHPREAYATGWLIRKLGGDMADMVPLTPLAGDRFWLTDEGDRLSRSDILGGVS